MMQGLSEFVNFITEISLAEFTYYSSIEGSGEKESRISEKKNSIFERNWTQKRFKTELRSDFRGKTIMRHF